MDAACVKTTLAFINDNSIIVLELRFKSLFLITKLASSFWQYVTAAIILSGGTTYFSKVRSQTWSGHFYALNLFYSYLYAINFLKRVIFLFK